MLIPVITPSVVTTPVTSVVVISRVYPIVVHEVSQVVRAGVRVTARLPHRDARYTP